MLVLRRDEMFRWGVSWSGTQMGVLDMSSWRLTPQGDLYASDGHWHFCRYGLGSLVAEQPADNAIAWAKNSGFFRPRWDVTTPYGPLGLFRERLSVVGISSQETQVGRIVFTGLVNRSVAVQAPSDVHLWVQVFLAWIALLWSQSSTVAATAM